MSFDRGIYLLSYFLPTVKFALSGRVMILSAYTLDESYFSPPEAEVTNGRNNRNSLEGR